MFIFTFYIVKHKNYNVEHTDYNVECTNYNVERNDNLVVKAYIYSNIYLNKTKEDESKVRF